MNIEQLAIKRDIHICKYDRQDLFEGNVVFDSIAQLKAFADEWLALNSSEPVGYVTQKLLDFWLERVSSNEIYAQMYKGIIGNCNVPLYLANPINQALLESHKRLEKALTTLNAYVRIKLASVKEFEE